MPKVHLRKAAKDYPRDGIKKGDQYYYTSLKLQRGGLVKRSLTPFRPSQLTNSPFKSGALAIGEAWADAAPQDYEAMETAAEGLRELGEAARESFDAMPEGLQQGDTGALLENRADECERLSSELDELATEYADLEEPTEPEEPEKPEEPPEPDDEESADFFELTDAYETYKDLLQEYEESMSEFSAVTEDYESELAEYESEKERIIGEADSLIGETPE